MSSAGWLEASRHWLILGSGGHGRSVADAIRAQGDAVVGFLDDGRPADELVAGVPVLGPLRLAWDVKTLQCLEGASSPDQFVVAIGNSALRQRWQQVVEAAGAPVGVVVHPCACVSPSAQLDPGCVVLAGAVVNADARLERGVLLNSGAVVDHDASGRWLHWQQARCSAAVSIGLLSSSWHQVLRICARVSAALAPRADPLPLRFALTAMRLSLWRATGSTGGLLVPQTVAHKRTQCGLKGCKPCGRLKFGVASRVAQACGLVSAAGFMPERRARAWLLYSAYSIRDSPSRGLLKARSA